MASQSQSAQVTCLFSARRLTQLEMMVKQEEVKHDARLLLEPLPLKAAAPNWFFSTHIQHILQLLHVSSFKFGIFRGENEILVLSYS